MDNKVALITGGANGIGRTTAELFIKKVIKVIIVDIDQKVYDIGNEIGAYPLLFDVSIEQNWKEIVKNIKKEFYTLDILVNNAAINGLVNNVSIQNPEYMSLDTWQMIHKMNLDSVFLGCKHGISLMKENIGNSTIVNVASRSGIVGVPNLSLCI